LGGVPTRNKKSRCPAKHSQTKAHLLAYNLQNPHIYFIFATHFARVALEA